MIKFNRNSWHLKLANFGSTRVADWLETDICTYIRAVIAGAVWAVFIFSVISVILSLLAYALYENYLWVAGEKLGPVGFILDISILVILALICYDITCMKLRNFRRKPRKVRKSDSFVSATYRKFKDKTCYKVGFE